MILRDEWDTNLEIKGNIINCINSDTSDSNMFTNSTSHLLPDSFQINITDENNQSFADTIPNTTELIYSASHKLKTKIARNKATKKTLPKLKLLEQHSEEMSPPELPKCLNDEIDLNLISEKDILLIKNLYCSPMIFATKILLKIFSHDELCDHNLSGKSGAKVNRGSKTKKPLDETRVLYIQYLVEKYFDSNDKELLWKSCRKAITRVLRNLEKKSVRNTHDKILPTNESFYSNKEPLNVNSQYETNVIDLSQVIHFPIIFKI